MQSASNSAWAVAAFALLLGACVTPNSERKSVPTPVAMRIGPAPLLGETLRDCPDCPTMIILPAGRFRMGSPPDEANRDADEGPTVEINITRPFAIGRFEVTRGQFAAFVRATGYDAAAQCLVWTGERLEAVAGRSWQDPVILQQDDHPVVCVSWRDATAYAAWLAHSTGEPYRLPSNAEWEYAARGGTRGAYAFPGSESAACTSGNVGDRSAKAIVPVWRTADCDDGFGFGTAPVGSYEPNGFGVHDTIGNVWEWIADCYRPSYHGAPADGSAWGAAGDCGEAFDRGGGFTSLLPGHLRSANRSKAPSPDVAAYSLGFRVARDLGGSDARSR